MVCNICGGAGRLRYDAPFGHPNFGKTYACECQTLTIAQRIQKRIGTPYNADLSLDDLKIRGAGSRAMKEAACEFIKTPLCILTIHGSNGNGKTTCLQVIVNECLKVGYSALYMSAADLMEFLKAGIGDNDYSVDDRLGSLSTIPVLCIDEISGMNFTDWVQEKFGVLIDRRYRLELGTVLALDDNPENILHRRVISRIKDGTIVENLDTDMRPLIGKVRS